MVVEKLESEIRELVNNTAFSDEIIKTRKADWDKLTAAMDVIGDTCLALAYYEELHEPHYYKETARIKIYNTIRQLLDDIKHRITKKHVFKIPIEVKKENGVKTQLINWFFKPPRDRDNYGSTYLYLYGFLQAIYVQQDAIIFQEKAILGKDLEKYIKDQRWSGIRNIRNEVVGHPVYRNRTEIPSSYMLSRLGISRWSINLLRFNREGMESINYNLRNSYNDYIEVSSERLKQVIEFFKKYNREEKRGNGCTSSATR